MKNKPDNFLSDMVMDADINDFGIYGSNFSGAERFSYTLLGEMMLGRDFSSICHINAPHAKLPVFLAEYSLDSFSYLAYCRDKGAMATAQMDYGSFSFRADLLAIEMDFIMLNGQIEYGKHDFCVCEITEGEFAGYERLEAALASAQKGAIVIFHFLDDVKDRIIEKFHKKIKNSGIIPSSISHYIQNEIAVFKIEF